MHTGEIELALARYFNTRENLIVPNISWGLGLHEIDLLVLTSSAYAYEIEIKTSLSDLKADKNKKHQHLSNKIRRLYFAIPLELKEKALNNIPERAGLFTIEENTKVTLIKPPLINLRARKFNDKEIKKLYELSNMRLWNLKEVIYRLQKGKS